MEGWRSLFGLFFITFIHTVIGENVIILHPVYTGSHHNALRIFASYLANEKGHNVTMVKMKESPKKYSDGKNFKVIELALIDKSGWCSDYVNKKGKKAFSVESNQ